MPELFKKLNNDMQKAMKDRDNTRLDVLRMMKSKVLNINARGDLPDAEITKILQKYSKSLKDAIEETKKVNRPEAVKKLEGELKVVEEYVPKSLTEDETKEIIRKVISEVGAATPQDVGKVMKALMTKGLNIDGKTANRIAAGLLAPKPE